MFFLVGLTVGGNIMLSWGVFGCFLFSNLRDFTSLVFFISLVSIFFSILGFCFVYFGEGLDIGRFLIIFFCFAVSMGVLVFHSSIFTLFLAWDGLGVRSFFLVAYYINWVSVNGAMVTVLTNRFGDFCLFWFFAPFLSEKNFMLVSCLVPFIVLGAATKRAQYPFRNWLPLAMAAPTPVSSLVHRRTLVTAGIFLMLRYYFFLEAKVFCLSLFLLGVSTVVLGGLRSLLEKDFKKIVALSTLSQIGLITISLGLSMPVFTFWHLVSHAFFKSCLFIQVGNIMLTFFGSQDARLYSKPASFSSSTSFTLLTCLISLCGLFFLRGFYTKEAILMFFCSYRVGALCTFFVWARIVLTFFYSLRLIWSLLRCAPNSLFSSGGLSATRYSSALLLLGVGGGFFLSHNSFRLFFFFVGLKSFFLSSSGCSWGELFCYGPGWPRSLRGWDF